LLKEGSYRSKFEIPTVIRAIITKSLISGRDKSFFLNEGRDISFVGLENQENIY